MTEQRIHHGQNIKRFRELLGIKQELLAHQLGEDWSQKKVSLLEAKEVVEPEILEQVAKILKVPAEAIKNFNAEGAVTYFNTFNDNSLSNSNGAFSATHCTFNPIDKLIETVEENKKLYAALLKEKDEKIALLERLLAEKK
jgi:transcriptional regulator with XRE-family HTH domain